MLEDQKKFLEKQLRTTNFRYCARVKLLEDAIKDIVLQQARIGLLAGVNLIGKATTTITGPDFVQAKSTLRDSLKCILFSIY